MKTVNALRNLGANVVLVRDVPDQMVHVPIAIEHAIRDEKDIGKLGVTLKTHRATQAQADKVFFQNEGDHIYVVDPAPYLTDGNGLYPLVMGGKCLYWDNDHLTVSGAERLVLLFESVFEKVFDAEVNH